MSIPPDDLPQTPAPPFNFMKEVRFYLLAAAIVGLLVQVWLRYRHGPLSQIVWVVLLGCFLVSIWLGTKKVRRDSWPHMRKMAALLFLMSVVGGVAVLCSVHDDPPPNPPQPSPGP